MLISFRTNLFDTTSPIPKGGFYGKDLAEWLEARLNGWQTCIGSEDWGWCIEARKNSYDYSFGVYEPDPNNVSRNGLKWIIRLFNEVLQANSCHRVQVRTCVLSQVACAICISETKRESLDITKIPCFAGKLGETKRVVFGLVKQT